jgi:hypothetical protein
VADRPFVINATRLRDQVKLSITTFGPFGEDDNLIGKMGEIERTGLYQWVGWSTLTEWGSHD